MPSVAPIQGIDQLHGPIGGRLDDGTPAIQRRPDQRRRGVVEPLQRLRVALLRGRDQLLETLESQLAAAAYGHAPARPAVPAPAGAATGLVGRTVADVERDLILETLTHCLGNRTHAAVILGISIRTLRNKLREYTAAGLKVPASGLADRVPA